VLTHRLTGYTIANQTGNIADIHYYLFKQGWLAQASLLEESPEPPGGSVCENLCSVADVNRPRYCPDCRTWSQNILFFNLVVESNAVCSGPINEEALAHYEDVINTSIEYRVEPIVTLYHWDLPLYLQVAYGGWLSEQIVPDFLAYAKVVFGRYAPKVSKWVTINQPIGKYLSLSPSETSTLDA
jgi:hypothetical protein